VRKLRRTQTMAKTPETEKVEKKTKTSGGFLGLGGGGAQSNRAISPRRELTLLNENLERGGRTKQTPTRP